MHSEDDMQGIALLLNCSGMILFSKSYIVSYFHFFGSLFADFELHVFNRGIQQYEILLTFS
jgi:hypothetical protein